MLDTVFLQILNMSFVAGFVIAAILLVRLLLRRAPKIFSYLLWSVALLRLLCPISWEGAWSLLPVQANPIPLDIQYMDEPAVHTGLPMLNTTINPALPAPADGDSSSPLQSWLTVGEIVWLAGAVGLLAGSAVSTRRLRRRLRGAVRAEENVWLVKGLETPFVLGLFHPRIYLPDGLPEQEKEYILLHERTHIRRRDPAIRLLSYLTLCVYWFHPLVWAAFFLSGRDMELSCDESVLRRLGGGVKKSYCASLLRLATGRRIVGCTPLAFGEGDTGSRIRNVLRYRRPALWAVVAAVIVVAAVSVGLLTNPGSSASSSAPPSASPSGVNEAPVAVEFTVSRLQNGETISELDAASLSTEQNELCNEVIMNALMKSAAFDGNDIESLAVCYRIRQIFPEADDETHDYYAYQIDGQAVLQSGTDGWYTRIDDELFALLAAQFI